MNLLTTPSSHQHKWISYVLIIFTLSRIINLLAIYFGRIMAHTSDPLLYQLATLWDSSFFIQAARTLDFGRAFFPLFPLLVRLISLNGILSIEISAIVLNQLFLFLTLYILALYLEAKNKVFSVADIKFALIILAYSPMNIFFLAAYSEATFLFLTILALYFLEKDRPYLLAICGMLMGATRSIGSAMTIILIIHQLKRRKLSLALLFQVLISLSGLLLYSLYCQIHHGDFISYIHDEANWGRTGWIISTIHRWDYLKYNIDIAFLRDLLAFGLALLLSLVLFWNKFTMEGLLYLFFILPGFISGSTTYGIFFSSARLDAAVIPFYLALALIGRNNTYLKTMIIALSVLFLDQSWVLWTS